MTSISNIPDISKTVSDYFGLEESLPSEAVAGEVMTVFKAHEAAQEVAEREDDLVRQLPTANALGWQIARSGPQSAFHAQNYANSLPNAQAVIFRKAILERRGALEGAAAFLHAIAGVNTIGLQNRHKTARALEQARGLFEELAEKPCGKQTQQLLAQIGYVAHGGRKSYELDDAGRVDTTLVAYPDTGWFVGADLSDPETTVMPLDPGFRNILERVLRNNGCLFTLDAAGDLARKAMAAFVDHCANEERDDGFADVQKAYRWLEQVSPQAAELLAIVVGNYYGEHFGEDGRQRILSPSANLFDMQSVIRCANVIHGFENLGDVRLEPSRSQGNLRKNELFLLSLEIPRQKDMELLQSITAFVTACGKLKNEPCLSAYQALKAKSSELAKDLADRVHERYKEELSGLSGQFIIEEATNQELIDEIIRIAKEIEEERRSIAELWDEKIQTATSKDADHKSDSTLVVDQKEADRLSFLASTLD